MVIDLFGLTAEEVRARFPAVYQWVYERVKPERDQNNRDSYRNNWWIHGEPSAALRPALAGLPRYIATVETSRRRFFVFLDAAILPDNKLVNIALDDAYFLGVLSSRIHVTWALAAGSHLGVGNDPVYVKTACFETFPFPAATDAQKARIRALAEELDSHRKRQQGPTPQADPDRHVQRAGEAAIRRAVERGGEGHPRAGAGQRAPATARRTGRGRVRRLWLACPFDKLRVHAHRRGDPGAAGRAQRRARRRRSSGSGPLAAARSIRRPRNTQYAISRSIPVGRSRP